MQVKDKFFFGIVILCILLIAGMLFYMSKAGGQCLKNPYIYGASSMGDVECSCVQFVGVVGCPATFSFNDTDFEAIPNECGIRINTGNIKIPNITQGQ
jgi:hypothetical protein